ncbi:MAG: Tad domain-containing protein [Syntrophomonadaceae bacterium]|jgi:Flp pilus assembly protein TadG
MVVGTAKISSLIREEKGTVIVLMACAMMALVGFASLVTDAGLLYLNKVKLANAIDSAVLAGVQELPGDPENALDVANSYATINGTAEGEVTFTVAADHKSITGIGTRRVELVFARIMGMERSNVTARARANIAPVTSVFGAAPFGVIEDDFTYGEVIVLKEGAGDGQHKGWFGALSLGGTGANRYRTNIENGYNGEIKINDIIPTESGNMSGPTREGIEERINACHHVPQCTFNSFDKDCSRILLIPIVVINQINPGGHIASVKVVGFGAFLVDSYVGNGKDNEVKGSFIRYVIPDKNSSQGPDFGLYGSQLCE